MLHSHSRHGIKTRARIRSYWEKILPVYDDGLRELGFSRWLSETRYLYGELLKYLKEHPELDTRIEKPSLQAPP